MIRRKSSSLSSNFISFSAKVISFESLIHSQTILKGSKCLYLNQPVELSSCPCGNQVENRNSAHPEEDDDHNHRVGNEIRRCKQKQHIDANCRKFLGSYPIIWFFAYYQFLLLICCIEIWQSFHFV